MSNDPSIPQDSSSPISPLSAREPVRSLGNEAEQRFIAELRQKAEMKLEAYTSRDEKDNTKVILRTLIKTLPQDGQRNVYEDMVGTGSDEELHQLTQHFFGSVIMPMKSRPKSPSPVSPRSGAEASIEGILSSITEPALRKEQSKLREHCLVRDNYKCIASGWYSINDLDKIPKEEKSYRTSWLEAARIFPFCLGSFKTNHELYGLGNVWDGLYRCFPSVLDKAKLNVDTLNDTSNALTLTMELHRAFGTFRVAFKPTIMENTYEIKTYPTLPTSAEIQLPQNGVVSFQTQHPFHQLPHPSLLEAHAAICEFLHLSGMGEYVEKILREKEGLRCFAEDGSTDVRVLLLSF